MNTKNFTLPDFENCSRSGYQYTGKIRTFSGRFVPLHLFA